MPNKTRHHSVVDLTERRNFLMPQENPEAGVPCCIRTRPACMLSAWRRIRISPIISFGTRNRVRALDKPRREELYRFILGAAEKAELPSLSHWRSRGHIHVLTSLHPTVALADLIREVKTASSAWIKGRKVFPFFEHWQEGYGAFTVSAADRPGLIEYVKNQEAHHERTGFLEELQEMVEKHQLVWKPDYPP